MYRLLWIYLLGWLTNNVCFAQIKKIGSIRAVLTKHAQLDTFRINRLNEFADAFIDDRKPNDSVANGPSLPPSQPARALA